MHWTREGKIHLCAIKDVYSNRLAGWAIDSRMTDRLVVAAIEMVVARRDGIVLRAPPAEVLDRQWWATRDELRIEIVTWIEPPTTSVAARPASAD